MAGSSAADTPYRKRLTGSADRFCAYVSAATDPEMQERRNPRIYIGADLDDASTDEHRPEVRTTSRTCEERVISPRRSLTEQLEHHRQLHEHLERAADNGAPRKPHCESRQAHCSRRTTSASRSSRRSIAQARVREEELAMTVENPEAPRRQNEQPRSRERARARASP
jgi:hypothetical protein